MKYRVTLLSFVLALLTACGSTAPTPDPSPNAGRYSINQDRAPDGTIDIADIPEVIPVPIERTLAGNRSPYEIFGQTYHVMDSEAGYSERGVASWYGEKFHGHRTSNGEIFDMYLASAAHKSLPIPSFLRVTNLDNNRSLIVRVNDRGPFHGDRIVDLSYAAALKLGYADRGTARVQLEAIVASSDVVPRRQTADSLRVSANETQGQQYLQVGAFANLLTAQTLSAQLQDLTNYPVFIRSVDTPQAGRVHRVRVGPINSAQDAQFISQRVVAANLGSPYTVTE